MSVPAYNTLTVVTGDVAAVEAFLKTQDIASVQSQKICEGADFDGKNVFEFYSKHGIPLFVWRLFLTFPGHSFKFSYSKCDWMDSGWEYDLNVTNNLVSGHKSEDREVYFEPLTAEDIDAGYYDFEPTTEEVNFTLIWEEQLRHEEEERKFWEGVEEQNPINQAAREAKQRQEEKEAKEALGISQSAPISDEDRARIQDYLAQQLKEKLERALKDQHEALKHQVAERGAAAV